MCVYPHVNSVQQRCFTPSQQSGGEPRTNIATAPNPIHVSFAPCMYASSPAPEDEALATELIAYTRAPVLRSSATESNRTREQQVLAYPFQLVEVYTRVSEETTQKRQQQQRVGWWKGSDKAMEISPARWLRHQDNVVGDHPSAVVHHRSLLPSPPASTPRTKITKRGVSVSQTVGKRVGPAGFQ